MKSDTTLGQPVRLAVNAKEVGKLLGIGTSQVFKLVAKNQFPAPVRLGKRNPRWLISDLEAFMRKGGATHG